MKLAIISVTSQGALLGQKLAGLLPAEYQSAIYEKTARQSGGAAEQYEALQTLLREIWLRYQAFVFIMATGIVVREIAKLIRHKSVDPAIVTLDELGLNCISLLSGHLGGANELTKVIASVLGANPVITTASDLSGLVAPDAVSKKLNLDIDDYRLLKKVNGSIVAREKVGFFIDTALPEAKEVQEKARAAGIEFAFWQQDAELSAYQAVVFISERSLELAHKCVLYLRPKNLVVGVGCRRGTSQAALRQALTEAVNSLGYSLKGLKALASAWVKADEEGLLALAEELKVPLEFYGPEMLQNTIETNRLSQSEFVKKEIGVGNVCEAAALTLAPQAKLVQEKTSYQGITLAVARANFMS